MSKFSDSPFYILEDFLDVQTDYGYVYPTTGHLVGGRSGIIAKNSFGFDLYLKADEKYYRINVQNTDDSPNGDYLTFVVPEGNYNESELTAAELANYVGYELYFRKEGIFYDFVNSYVPETYDEVYTPNINTNKFYTYLGKLYTTSDNTIVVKYNGYRTYVNDIIPENNRNDLLTEFINLSFDRIYHSCYNLFKNLLSLSDTKETDIDYLYYLAKMYRMTVPENIDDIKKREYVAALPELMKRKGTYSSLYIIWKVICSNTTNYLNIYERWNDWPFNGYPLANFTDVLYTFNPLYQKSPPTGGAGVEYYYSGSNTFFTTYFLTATNTWSVAHNLLNQYPFVQIISSIEGSYDELVWPGSISYDTTKLLTISFGDDAVAGRAITIPGSSLYTNTYTPSNTWNVGHSLGVQYPIVQVINTDNEMIIPDEIYYNDSNNLTITFSDSVEGRVIAGITATSYTHTQSTSASTWSITHNLATEDIIVQVINDNDYMVEPGSIKIISENQIEITFSTSPDLVAGTAVIYSAAGTSPYPTYSNGNSMLSPHYLVEIDLTNEPFGNDYVINQDLIDELMSRWEEIRPVCKYAHYREVISPITNFSGMDIELYDNTTYNGYLYTKCCQPVRNTVTSDVSIYRTYTNRSTWTVGHNLNSENVIVQCFDLNQNMIVPKTITVDTANILIIEWETAVAGYAYVSKEQASSSYSSSTIWTLTHSLGLSATEGMVIQQTENNSRSVFLPLSVVATDDNTMTFNMSVAEAGYAMVTTGSYSTSASEDLKIWTITHSLDTAAVQVQFYDEYRNVVYPKNVQIIDRNTIRADFDTYIKPGVVVKSIGLQTDEITTIYNNMSYAKVGSGDNVKWDPILKNDLETAYMYTYVVEKSSGDQYFGKIVINTPVAMNITEIGIFDTSNNIQFYTKCSEIYKPENVELIIWYRIDKTVT